MNLVLIFLYLWKIKICSLLVVILYLEPYISIAFVGVRGWSGKVIGEKCPTRPPPKGGYMTCAPLMGSPVEGVHQRWREPEDAWLGGSSGEPSQGADVS